MFCRAKSVETMEGLKDVYQHFLLYYGCDIPKMKNLIKPKKKKIITRRKKVTVNENKDEETGEDKEKPEGEEVEKEDKVYCLF